MNPQTTVSIHPYFKPHEGQAETFKAMLPVFIERTSDEEACLYYDFTLCDDIVFCREAYTGGEGALAHLENVGDLLAQALEISDLIRLEVHGAASELAKMRKPLEELPVRWFVLENGLEK
ncbi:MAG: hypothetical protein WD342_13605 [Verrucomicrobiales bacterium]